ncbi:MAG: hypothetical protein CVV44_13665 [Spirochaetae bacterium HGW-Spirochaetae-1]|jgi:hypothetical protein|nr:MAG: hypothetical protein CVV44_13665 [Spirochaetae bacterium HGW-Spirochaetae-1]
MYKCSEIHHRRSDKKFNKLTLNKSAPHLKDAAVFSSEKRIKGDFNIIESEVVSFIYRAAEWIGQNDGIIGHIKVSIQSGDRLSFLSLTEGDVSTESIGGSFDDSVVIIVAAIGISINEALFVAKLRQLFNEIDA